MPAKFEEVAHKLKLKYGLPVNPSDFQVTAWHDRVIANANLGKPAEQAGEEAAKQLFTGVGSIKYAAQGDTIESLLEEIRRKNSQGK